MGVPISEDDVTSLHVADRLQINLAQAEEDVEKMELEVFFKIFTVLPNGKVVGEPYLDTAKPLRFTCKNNPELKAAMELIQQTIGEKRYEQLTAQPEIPPPSQIPALSEISEPVENPEMIPPIENS